MSRPSARVTRIARWAAIPAALALSGVLVAQASYSAYSDTTVNPTNNWSSGTVKLTDDDANTAMFTATNLKPGATGTRCITVTSTGTLPSLVKLYGTGAATTNGLSSQINLSVVQGNGATNATCSGFTALTTGSSVYSGTLANFGEARTGYSNGAGNWTTAGGSTAETRSYQFTYTLDASAPNSSQGGTAAMGFTFEAQNT